MPDPIIDRTDSSLPDIGVLANIDQLPTISAVITEVLEITSSPSTSAMDLARAIGKDTALAARTLRIANSGYFGMPSKVVSVQQAVVVLGMDMVRACALGAAITQVLRPNRLVTGFSLEAFWHHSACVANTANDIARTTISSERQEAFTAGLMHDIGSLLLACHVPTLYAKVLTEGRQTNKSLRTIEQQLLGIDHAKLGGIIARHWGFPEVLADVIANHHTPAEASEAFAPLAAAVHIADAVAHGTGSPGCETAYAPRTDYKAWALLGGLRTGMHPGEAERCAFKLQQQAESVEKLSRALLVA